VVLAQERLGGVIIAIHDALHRDGQIHAEPWDGPDVSDVAERLDEENSHPLPTSNSIKYQTERESVS
jgi:hypothetical protein